MSAYSALGATDDIGVALSRRRTQSEIAGVVATRLTLSLLVDCLAAANPSRGTCRPLDRCISNATT